MRYKVTIGSGKNAKQRTLDIERVPYKVFMIAQRIEKKIESVRNLSNELVELEKELIDLKKEKPAGWKEPASELNQKIGEITREIYAVEDSGFFAERFEAIKLVLSVNGYGNDDELMEEKTWSEKMDYADPMAFIEACCKKDIDKKKVLAEALAGLTKNG